jgi:hypothetical protein
MASRSILCPVMRPRCFRTPLATLHRPFSSSSSFHSPSSAHPPNPTADATWRPPPPGTKVFACVSGGVDSSVAARLLLEQGYDVQPIFMRNWETLDESSSSTGGCEWERDYADVERICRENLGGLKPELVDLSKEYWNSVFEPALEEWAAGVTPNPDVACNQCAFTLFSPSARLCR